MSLKRRVKTLEDKAGIREPIIYYIVVTGIDGDKPIYHYEKDVRGKTTRLTIKEYKKDQEQEVRKGNILVTDNMVIGLDKLTTEELKILALGSVEEA